MRCAPTGNKQCIVEKEKAEITDVFIEPVFNRRGSVRRGVVCTYFGYTIHCSIPGQSFCFTADLLNGSTKF